MLLMHSTIFIRGWLVAILATLGSAARSHTTTKQQVSECRTIQVQPGDSCGALATRCGISSSDFTKYNSDPHLCSTLQPDQYVCCSPGSLPDLRPKPNPDGSCATYTSVPGDNCAKIGASRGLTVSDIDSMNKQTWGWDGCINLEAQQTFCISTGSPPMPAPVKDAICGPQVPGTQRPSDMSQLADLNPCPLKVCCNKWGQCGTTDEFCTISKSSTGNPGTSAKGTNGCISNCGMDIVNNGSPPKVFRRVGYFEAFNVERKCLNMDASQLAGSQYDTVHFGFAEITPDFQVDISGVQDQFGAFKQQSGFKKVVSFGGWSFSTSQDSFPIFRHGVTDANRDTFAQNVANFVHDNNLDGADFDWEYPGAPDIPGIPPGSPEDGANYLSFLKDLRSKLDSSKTISVAAPASYWYLKGFPIADISDVIDYIVYMTYDLHGQWDYANKFAAEGCPGGSCLRSHVNYTETINSLAMITKAGVPSNKIVVGVASYGRSFQMAKPGCSGPMCTFTGPASGAHPGVCTDTAGYISNAELHDIISRDSSAKTHYDQVSDSIIIQYGEDNWVAYMDDDIQKSRANSYSGKNFGGTVDWAIDLAQWYPAGTRDKSGHWIAAKSTPHGPPLSTDSTCLDLELYQGQQGAIGLLSEMWDEANTSQMLSDWYNNQWLPAKSDGFEASFLAQWGLYQSFSSCRITAICPNPNCNNMDDYKTQKGSGPAYMIAISMYNVMNTLATAYEAVDNAQSSWTTLQDWWQINFNTDGGEENSIILKEVLLSLAAAVAAVLALTEEPVAAAIAAVAGGVASGIVTSIPNPTDNSVQDLADFEAFMGPLFTSIKTALGNMYADLAQNGNSNGVDLQQIFKDGGWVDFHNIPILNQEQWPTPKINDMFLKHINAAAINWAWHNQRVWLMSYPMTEDEFNSRTAFSGNNDSRLKHYYKGRGYFFMSVYPQSEPLSPFQIPRVQNLPGWGKLGDLDITTTQIIESSADGFLLGGYEFNPIPNLAAILTSPGANIATNSVGLPGVFSIPICALDSSYGWTKTLDDFFDSLTGPGAQWDDNDQGSQSTLCYCLGVKDSFGKVFDNYIDLANWHGGQNPQCAENYNTPGGGLPKGLPRNRGRPPPREAKDEL